MLHINHGTVTGVSFFVVAAGVFGVVVVAAIVEVAGEGVAISCLQDASSPAKYQCRNPPQNTLATSDISYHPFQSLSVSTKKHRYDVQTWAKSPGNKQKLSCISFSVPPGSIFSQVAFGIVPLLPKQGINRMIGVAGGAPFSADFSANRWVSSLGSQGSPENKRDRVVGSVVSKHL